MNYKIMIRWLFFLNFPTSFLCLNYQTLDPRHQQQQQQQQQKKNQNSTI